MKKLIIYITLLLLTVGNIFSVNAQGAFLGRAWKGKIRLELNDDHTFFLLHRVIPHTGIWENKDEKTLLLHFDEITDIVLLLQSVKVFQGDYEAEILNKKELKLDGYVLTKIPWSSKPATLTLQDSVFTFDINNLSYAGVWDRKNERVSILHLQKRAETFFPLPDDAYRNARKITEFNIEEEKDKYIQKKIHWLPKKKDIRLEMAPDSTFTFLYRRKFYTGQWSKNTEKEFKLQFDEKPEFETLWNMGYFEIDESDPNVFGVFTSVLTEYRPLKQLQLNKNKTFILLYHDDIQTGCWRKKNNDVIRLCFDRIHKKRAKRRHGDSKGYFESHFDIEMINSSQLKFGSTILTKQ